MLRRLALACLVCLTGCGGFTAPALRVADAHLTERNDSGAVVTFVIEATNNNGDAVPLTRVDYTLRVNGRTVSTGVRSAEATVRRFGSHVIELPVALAAGEGVSFDGELRYTLEGEVGYLPPGAFSRMLIDAGLRRPTTGFSDSGSLVFSPTE